MIRRIHGLNIVGVGVDGETRCAHYRSERDIIAIKFKCCKKWFPCYECHAEFADMRRKFGREVSSTKP